MKQYQLNKRIYDLNNTEHVKYLQLKYKSYYTQRIEGSCYCLMYFDENLVFVKRNKKENTIDMVSVFAPAKVVRDYWCTYVLHDLPQHFYNLFYNRKKMLL